MSGHLLIIGLDSAPPKLLYEEFRDELPFLGGLIGDSARYSLRTCHPPITIPAWAVMVTGRSPGELGLYGFRHRKPGNYNEFYIANSRSVKAPTLWDELGTKGLRSVVAGVPPSYPPRPLKGYMVSDFITPGPQSPYTWPPTLRKELDRETGGYIFDVKFRTHERDKLIKELWAMTEVHFKALKYLVGKRWDFFMFVEIGVDRVQHAFWGYMDPAHRKYVPGNEYEHVILEYYKLIDRRVEELVRRIPKDTTLVVVSDHGAKAMKGAFCVNQWLIEEGYLKLEKEPKRPGTELNELKVDWRRSTAWGWGGYYARIFINLKGREPQGAVDPRDYESVRDQLMEDLKRIKGPNGERWLTKAYKPEELYPVALGDKPDLIVYFDDLSWRSAGTLGWPSNYLPENDRGPDDAVHDWYGVLSVYDPEGRLEGGRRGEVRIEEVRGILKSLLNLS